jgi:hypothetical protein
MERLMPEIDRYLFCTEPRTNLLFKEIVKLPTPKAEYWYLDSVKYFNQAYNHLEEYDQMLYLDTDTHPMHPFPELFEMAEKFDIVGVHGARRITGATFEPIPFAFPEFEIGVTVFARNERVADLLALWHDLHWAHPDTYGANDQRSLREAMWKMLPELRIGTAPSEYGCRWPFGTFVSLEVKILHGRQGSKEGPDAAFVESIINEHLDMRVWTPRSAYWKEGVQPRNY